MSSAPVCAITPPLHVASPQKRTKLQQLAPNATLPQIIRTINNNFHMIQNFINNSSEHGVGGDFHVRSRTTKITRVFDPEDDSVFVDVKHDIGITWANASGQTITWP